MENPAVSVIVISYNHGEFIEKCLTSILNQSFQNSYEVIFSDDASTDNTKEVVEEFLRNHPKSEIVKCFFQKSNLGIRGNIEFVLKNCKGKYIAICEGDDYWIRMDKLALQFEAMEEDPILSGLYTDVQIMDNKGNEMPNYYEKPPKVLLQTNDLIWRHYIPTCTYFFRSDIFKFAAYFSSPIINDRYIEMASTLLGPIKYLDIKTAVHIKHPGGASTNKYSRSKRFHHNYTLYHSIRSFFIDSGGEYQLFNFKLFACSIRLAIHSFKQFEVFNGVKFFFSAITIFLHSPVHFLKGYNAKF